MLSIKNAAPRAILQGIKDESGRAPVIDPELLPSHLAHVFLLAERGPLLPQLVVGDSLLTTYGESTFDYRSKFANHQTVLANILNGEANQMMVQRLVPDDATTATAVFCLDIVADDIPVYERNVDGSYKLDASGQKVEVPGSVVPGYRGRWVVKALQAAETLGGLSPTVGSLTSVSTAEQSTLYPIHAFTVSSPGAYGNLVGVRLSSPTIDSSTPIDDVTVEETGAYLYRLALVERPDLNSSPVIEPTLFGENYVDFAYKRGVINTRTDSALSFDDVILQGWNRAAVNGIPPTIGVVNDHHVYEDNIELVLTLLKGAEDAYHLISGPTTDIELFNFIGGHDHLGVPYYSYSVEGPAAGGVLLSENSTHYATGGSDGDCSIASYDAMVANICKGYGETGFDFLDSAIYPQSVIYDSGFTLDTKKALLTVLGRRKDMYVVLSTQDASIKQNSPSEESSLAISLRTAARMYPESEVFGTPVCRAMVIGHSGYLINSKYKGLLPLTLEFAKKSAAYMGAGDGVWKASKSFDISPANQVTMFRDVNATFKKVEVRSQDWDNGLVWVQNFDRRSLFFPGFQTVYDDDSSILNSFFNMAVAVELEKIAERTWRQLTGISSLTNGQFIARSNRLIEQAVAGRFDGRVVIVADTYNTGNDEQRGYSWSCRITMYGNNMKTVGSFTIVARRREDLEE